jgi:Domain of unknown function (DUF4919)
MRMPFLRVIVVLSICGVMATAVGAQLDNREAARLKYEGYKARVTSGELAVDWRAFRLAAAVGDVSEGFDWKPVHDRVVDDLGAGRYEQALKESQTVIDRNMANGEGHLLTMTTLQKMGKNEEAKKEQAILDAIGKSIMESGDGNSAATAWFTVAPSETYFFLTEALGAQIEGHELVQEHGHAYDKMTVLDRQGKRRIAWFNTDTNEELRDRALHPNPKASK